MADEITGADLRRARQSKGWGLEKLAGQIGVSKGHLSKVERGLDSRHVTNKLIQAYKDALRIPITRTSGDSTEQTNIQSPSDVGCGSIEPGETASAGATWPLASPEQARGGCVSSEQPSIVTSTQPATLSAAHPSPTINYRLPLDAGMRALDALTTWVALQGSARLRPVVLEQVQRLDQERHRQPQHPRLALADARWSEFMSWISDNDGSADGGQWLSRAYQRAVEAGDHTLAAYALMRSSQRALDTGDVRTGLHLARQALQGPQLPPKIDALCHARLAEALALVGDDEALELTAQARQRAGSAHANPGDSVAAHCDHRYLAATDARCRHLLGDYRTATRILEEVLDDTVPDSPLNTGMWLAYLADSHRPTDPEKAADTGTEALTVAQHCGSVRIVRTLLPLALALRPHRNLPPVERFLTAHRTALAGNLTGWTTCSSR